MAALNRILLLASVAQAAILAQVTAPGMGPTNAELIQALGSIFRWKAHWHGSQDFPGKYVPGARVQAKVVRSSREVAVFVSAIGVNVRFPVSLYNKILPAQMGDHRANDTNDSAARRYLAQRTEEQDCVPVKHAPPGESPAVPGSPGIVPMKRVCPSGTSPSEVSEQDLWLVLPPLDPPESVALRKVPSSLRELKPLVAGTVGGFGTPDCHMALSIIPYYADEDPWVYVLVERTCGERAVYIFSRDTAGQWEVGKLLLDRPPNDLSWTIGQIKKAAMATLLK